MEIERKYLIRELPENLETYAYHDIEQAYLCTAPVVRIRRQDHRYILTYKSSGMMAHEEYNLPLTREAYEHLKAKADGNVITKRRYLIPLDDVLTIELDLFSGTFAGMILAELPSAPYPAIRISARARQKQQKPQFPFPESSWPR